mmetsp:Transcript_41031/g.116194  ORF Transcript_41031/g.116194 Transcript_41031/m.116194 type:complete len:257 (-) Transcript_41031:331-1101(-)
MALHLLVDGVADALAARAAPPHRELLVQRAEGRVLQVELLPRGRERRLRLHDGVVRLVYLGLELLPQGVRLLYAALQLRLRLRGRAGALPLRVDHRRVALVAHLHCGLLLVHSPGNEGARLVLPPLLLAVAAPGLCVLRRGGAPVVRDLVQGGEDEALLLGHPVVGELLRAEARPIDAEPVALVLQVVNKVILDLVQRYQHLLQRVDLVGELLPRLDHGLPLVLQRLLAGVPDQLLKGPRSPQLQAPLADIQGCPL